MRFAPQMTLASGEHLSYLDGGGEERQGKQGTWSTANSNNNNCHTHTHIQLAATPPASTTAALQMWFHFNYPWRQVQTAAATKSLYPSTGLSVMSVPLPACPTQSDCLSVCLCVRLSRVSFCCRANISFCALCSSVVVTLQSAADNVAYVQFSQFPLAHTGALTHTNRNTLIHTQRRSLYAGHSNERKLKR